MGVFWEFNEIRCNGPSLVSDTWKVFNKCSLLLSNIWMNSTLLAKEKKSESSDLLQMFPVPATSRSNSRVLMCFRSCRAFPRWPSLVWERRQWYAGPLSSDRPRGDQLLPQGVRGEASSQGPDVCRWSQGWHHDQKREARVSSALLALLCRPEGQACAVREIHPESEGR